MSVPAEALSQMKCSACNKYLSYFPIYIQQDSEQNSPICGRCCDLLIANGQYTRDKTFESLVQYLKFPCSFSTEGCVETLLPADIPEHEKYCPYRIISCSLDCIWQGAVNELLSHFEELHPNTILRNGEFEVDTLHSYNIFNLFVYKDEIFSFKRNFNIDENVLHCSFFCYKILDTVTEYKYELTMLNAGRNLSVQFTPKSADNFIENNTTSVNIDDIKKTLGDPSIIIGHVKIFTNEDDKIPLLRKQDPEIHLEMLSELECPLCFDYIIPPIYQCVTGHSICGDCKHKIHKCPSCQEEIKNTQNFTLEKMAFLLTYPCKYTDYGCDFISKPGKMRAHQKHCLFGPQQCPLHDYEKCVYQSAAKDIYSHVFNVHHDNILEIDSLSEFIDDDYFTNENSLCYIKKFSNTLFKLHYRYSQNCFSWAVQLIGQPEEAKNYRFEIDIQDGANSNRKIFLRNFCAPLTDRNEAFSEEGSYVYLELGQIRTFITDQLTYSIRIVK